jgi:hypothetical protein
MSPDLVAGVIAFLFTLMIFSYLIGDNPLFRIAIYIFVGVSAGYVATVAWWQVLWPNVVVPVLMGTPMQKAVVAVPILLSGLLLMKAWPPLSRLGLPAMGLLVGTGAAVAIGGAVSGTLLPQINAMVAGIPARRRVHIGRSGDEPRLFPFQCARDRCRCSAAVHPNRSHCFCGRYLRGHRTGCAVLGYLLRRPHGAD